MRILLKLHGTRVATTAHSHPASRHTGANSSSDWPYPLLQHEEIKLGRQRDTMQPEHTLELEETDTLCLRLANGFEWCLSAAEAVQMFGRPLKRNGRSGASGVANELAEDGSTLAIFDFDPTLADTLAQEYGSRAADGNSPLSVQSVARYQFDFGDASALRIAETIEKHSFPDQQLGLKHLSLAEKEPLLSALPPANDQAKDQANNQTTAQENSQPLLVFIHGTGSSTSGSFGELWHSTQLAPLFSGTSQGETTAAKQLHRKYGERAFAFEYASISKSPISNTLALAQSLPIGAELHVVTHSQGGLLGELLCLAQLQAGSAQELDNQLAQLKMFFQQDRTVASALGLAALADNNSDAYAQEWEMFVALWQELQRKKFRITRFVRVACPAMGTTLASGKLDRWLSVIKHLIGITTHSVLAQGLMVLICAIIKRRTDPRTLPGVEAMMPGSALVRVLNHSELVVQSDLSIIAGNMDKRTGLSWLLQLTSRQFFESRNDLVVNTGSMYGGLRRELGRAHAMLDSGKQVSHFNYFKNAASVNAMLTALLYAETAQKTLFSAVQEAQKEAPARSAIAKGARGLDASGQAHVLFLPGVMGSTLQVNNECVWLELMPLIKGSFEKLRFGNGGVKVGDVFDQTYGDFIAFLRQSHQVHTFPYDWRQSISVNADALAAEISQHLPQLERSKRPLRIVAHSMGGLVARAMLAKHDDLWRRLQALPGFRFIMVGTPNFGSYQGVLMQIGQHHICQWLALADLQHNKQEVQAIIASFKGSTEMLPFYNRRFDFMKKESWAELHHFAPDGWSPPLEEDLKQAAATRELLLNAPIDPKTMIYVAGWASATPAEIALEKEQDFFGNVRHKINVYSSRRGDGTVLWDDGVLRDVPAYYVEKAEHDQLLNLQQAFPAYLELLQTGSTHLLPRQEPSASRGADGSDERRLMQIEVPQYQPTLDNFGGFGGARKRMREAAPLPRLGPVRVRVSHGDLAYARHPVVVGHYEGDTMVSAERQLDAKLKGELRQRAHLGIYPGALGTWAVFIANQAENRPGGALVVGLGQVGELSPGSLQAGLTAAVTDFALQVANWHDGRFGGADAPRHAALTFLLVGTGAGGVAVQDCISAILHSVKSVNDKLTTHLPENRALPKSFIDEIEILELFYDVALQASSALARALLEPELQNYFLWNPCELIDTGTGCFRSQYEQEASWWQRTEISFDKKSQELRFVALTRRARAEQALVAGQMRLAKNFIRQAIGSTKNEQDISRTLFEMLLPNRLKEASPERLDLVLLLDEESAQFPWEMLEDRWSGLSAPPAVAAGMIRQLKTIKYRSNVQSTNADSVLVVGNPKPCVVGDHQLIDLTGAKLEAQQVADFFCHAHFSVRQEIETDADDILVALHAAPYRILHLAGHGVHQFATSLPQPDEDCPEFEQTIATQKAIISGMVIGENMFLTAADIEQMRWVPELVFINCCHLASTQMAGEMARHNELAANLGAQFIRMGVKAVVAAGWEVADHAACAFAQKFYEEMLAGTGFGHAVQRARRHIYEQFQNVNTWGAYQCYGDPDFRLVANQAPESVRASEPYFSYSELIIDLNNLTQSARFGEVKESQLQALLARIPDGSREKWFMRGDVLGALAQAHGELTQFKKAFEYLDAAVKLKDGKISLVMLENRANFKSRFAAQVAQTLVASAQRGSHIAIRSLSNDAEEKILCVSDLFSEAENELTNLINIEPTSERHHLLASAWKRQAWVLEEGREKSLQKMQEHYEKALAFARPKTEFAATLDGAGVEGDPQGLSYAKLNLALLKVVRASAENALSAQEIADIVQQCEEVYQQENSSNHHAPNFWAASAMPQSRLIAALAQDQLPQRYAEIKLLFQRAMQPGASRRQLASVIDNLQFIITLRSQHAGREQEIASLEGLCAMLRKSGEA